MRSLGIILAILAATLYLSLPYYVLAYASVSNSVPSIVFFLAIDLAGVAVGLGAWETWKEGQDRAESAAREANTTETLDRVGLALGRIATVLEARQSPPSLGPSEPRQPGPPS